MNSLPNDSGIDVSKFTLTTKEFATLLTKAFLPFVEVISPSILGHMANRYEALDECVHFIRMGNEYRWNPDAVEDAKQRRISMFSTSKLRSMERVLKNAQTVAPIEVEALPVEVVSSEIVPVAATPEQETEPPLFNVNTFYDDLNAIKQVIDGKEWRSARDYQNLLGYARWEDFERVICKAKSSMESQGYPALERDHFRQVPKMVDLGSGAEREIPDYLLSRKACDHIAMNCDSRKERVQAAHDFFSVSAEIVEKVAEQVNIELEKLKFQAAIAASQESEAQARVRELELQATLIDKRRDVFTLWGDAPDGRQYTVCGQEPPKEQVYYYPVHVVAEKSYRTGASPKELLKSAGLKPKDAEDVARLCELIGMPVDDESVMQDSMFAKTFRSVRAEKISEFINRARMLAGRQGNLGEMIFPE